MSPSFRFSRLLLLAACACQALVLSQVARSQSSSTAVDFGPVNIGSASPATSVTLRFYTAATPGQVSVLTQGASGFDFALAQLNSCTEVASGGVCTVYVTFAPKFAGTRYGAVLLQDSASGNVIATNYLQGTGVGPQVNFLPGFESEVSNGAWYPSATAVDGSGNVYIADSSNNRILKETLTASGYSESAVATSSLSYPSGIAVDGSGSIYIADTGNNRVLKETFAVGSYTESTVPTTALVNPYGVAVDGAATSTSPIPATIACCWRRHLPVLIPRIL